MTEKLAYRLRAGDFKPLGWGKYLDRVEPEQNSIFDQFKPKYFGREAILKGFNFFVYFLPVAFLIEKGIEKLVK